MNKYIKLAVKKKLEDNDIGIGDKFKVDCWNSNNHYYTYDGNDIYNNDYDYMVKMTTECNFYDFINAEITKVDEYKQIDFETTFKIMSGGDVVYLRNFKGESIVELRISTSSDGWEYIVSKPWHGGNMKFSNLCDFEFYKKI